MPSFSACILILGTVGAFFGAELLAVKLACYIMGCIVFLVMVWFNRKQIIEYSNGQEGKRRGGQLRGGSSGGPAGHRPGPLRSRDRGSSGVSARAVRSRFGFAIGGVPALHLYGASIVPIAH